MINIASFKVLKGYEHWKTVFMDEAFVKRLKEAGVKILAKGFDAQNDRVYVIQEWIQWKSSKMPWQETRKKL